MSFLASLFGGADPNAPLKALMLRLARAATPELEKEFYRALATSSLRLLSPSLESQGIQPGSFVAGTDGRFRMLGTLDPAGRRAGMAFTDNQAVLLRRPAGCDTVELRFPALCWTVLDAGLESLLINPGSPECCLVPKAELAEFAAGRIPAVPGEVRAETLEGVAVTLSAWPQPPPPVLCEALRAEAAAHAAIVRVYLAAAALGDKPPQAVVAMEFDDGADLDSVVPPFASGATVRLGGRSIPDVLPLGDPALRDQARARATLVYER